MRISASIRLIFCAVASLLFSMPLMATTCSITSSGVAFGSYRPNQNMPADYVGRVTVSCSKSTLEQAPVTVNYSINFSSGNSIGFSPREMANGLNTLHYNLYRDTSRSNVWGDTTGGTSNTTG